MLFNFSPAIEAGIEAGKYAQVFSNGVPISMARDAVTGKFVAHAVAATVDGNPLSPLISPFQFVTKGANIIQTHMGFQETYQQIGALQSGLQTLQNSVGVLQATTALIGVGTVAGVALGAVNLQQTLKLRKEVEQMRLEITNGFIDLKQALKQQGAEIRQIIEKVAQDIKFEQHRVILVRAYGLFSQALQRFRSAMQIKDDDRRNAEIDAVRGMLFEALAGYTNPQLLEENCIAGQLRRLECAWAIEQTIVVTYQVQNEVSAVSDRLGHLEEDIRDRACMTIAKCDSYEELDFLFPELSRIRNHDLAVVETWKNQVDWVRSLSPSELKLLSSADFNTSEFNSSEYKDTPQTDQSTTALAVPPEQLIYENLSEKSHFKSLRDQLRFMFQPELREDYEVFINEQGALAGYKTLVPKNLQQASNLAIANLYHYFKIRDESEIIDNSEEEELGIYTKLCDLLATENWQEADNETAEIIFQLSKQEYKMSSEYANNVSADDFRIIDKLWLKYSKGRFGFSVQKRIWQEESEESDKLGEFDNNKIYARFCEAVGWRVINGCLLSSYLNFTLNAPLGHFPVAVAGQGWSAASFLESLTWKL